MKIYLVGGAVRDQLLNKPNHEKDYVVVGATPERLLSLGYTPIGKDFPVFLHPKTKEEYALARTERKTGKGYAGFTFYTDPSVSLEEDLKRRDLTINAMAMDEHGNLIDPFQGKKDLENKLLRHVSDTFVEDPVRVLRVARFMARFGLEGFNIVKETQIFLRAMVRSGEMNDLVVERVWQEWQRSLTEPAPQKFIEVLRQCGALAVLFPEIDKLFGVPSPAKYHPEIDTGMHVLMVLAQAARTKNPLVCFAALMHDLGKGETPLHLWPSHPGHEAKGKTLVKNLCQRYKIPRDYTELAMLVAEYHLYAHCALELKPATLLKLFEKLDAFRRPERFYLFLQACEADFYGRKNFEEEKYLQKEFLLSAFKKVKSISIPDLENLNLTGEQIKKELRRLRLKVLRHT